MAAKGSRADAGNGSNPAWAPGRVRSHEGAEQVESQLLTFLDHLLFSRPGPRGFVCFDFVITRPYEVGINATPPCRFSGRSSASPQSTQLESGQQGFTGRLGPRACTCTAGPGCGSGGLRFALTGDEVTLS